MILDFSLLGLSAGTCLVVKLEEISEQTENVTTRKYSLTQSRLRSAR